MIRTKEEKLIYAKDLKHKIIQSCLMMPVNFPKTYSRLSAESPRDSPVILEMTFDTFMNDLASFRQSNFITAEKYEYFVKRMNEEKIKLKKVQERMADMINETRKRIEK